MHGLDLMLHGPLVRTFLRYCIPWTLAMLLQSSAAIVDGFFVGRYVGAMSLAALNLVMPMFSLFFGVGVMLASGGAVRAGKYLGEKRPEAASAIFTKTMLSLLLVGLAASAGMLLFSGELSYLFVGEAVPEVHGKIRIFLLFNSFSYIILALIVIFRNAMQGMGHAFIATVSVGCELLARIFGAVFLAAWWGYVGVCAAGPFSWICGMIPMGIAYCWIMSRYHPMPRSRPLPEKSDG